MTTLTLYNHMTATPLSKSSPIPIAALFLSISDGIIVPLWFFQLFVSTAAFFVVLEYALASEFTSNCESLKISHDLHFEFKIILKLSLDSS